MKKKNITLQIIFILSAKPAAVIPRNRAKKRKR